jgi:SAM-dependent methyltransferase
MAVKNSCDDVDFFGSRFLTGRLQDQLENHYGYGPDWSNRWRHRQRIDFVSRWLKGRVKPRGLRALDLGCGCGVYTILLRRLGATVIAADVDDGYVDGLEKWSQEEGLGCVPFCVADAQNLPFDQGSFDVIICSCVLPYLANPERCIQEIGRVLRDGGLCILTEENANSFRSVVLAMLWNERIRRLRGLGPVPPIWRRRVKDFPYWRVRQWCEKSGLVIVGQGSSNILPTYNFGVLARLNRRWPWFSSIWEGINRSLGNAYPFCLFGSHYYALARRRNRTALAS